MASDYREAMTYKISAAVLTLAFAMLSSCGLVQRVMNRDPQPAAISAPASNGPLTATAPLRGAQSAAALDQSTAAEKAAATSAPNTAAERDLGKVVVALGSPAEQGFWLRSALVKAPGKGRVVTASGASVNVDLQPATGAALLSLAAYRALGLELTDLPKITVYAK